MSSDPIVEEIHQVREALSKASDNDIRKIAEAARARQIQSGRKAVRLPPRKPRLLARLPDTTRAAAPKPLQPTAGFDDRNQPASDWAKNPSKQ
jgi:hypothetical protein